MSKKVKIKHYDTIYNSKSKGTLWKPLKVIITVIIIIILAFIGWSLYTPVYNFIMTMSNDKNTTNNESNINISSQIQNMSSSEQSSEDKENLNTVKPQENGEVNSSSDTKKQDNININGIEYKSVYMPVEIAQNRQKADEFIENSKNAGINTILLDLKQSDGIINILTKNEIAQNADAINPNAKEIENTISAIKKSNIKIIAEIATFKDPLTPKYNPKAKIFYMNSNFEWMDRSPEEGGQQWLNPYSRQSKEYIYSITDDIVSLGVDALMFDNVQFPSGEALEKATYGEVSNTKSKNQALQDFIKETQDRYSSKKLQCLFYVNAYNAFYPNVNIYGGNVLDLYDETNKIVLNVMPENYSNMIAINGNNYQNNIKFAYSTVDVILSNLEAELQAKNTIVMLQAHDNKIKSDAQNIQKQIEAAKSYNIDNFILYNPVGEYNYIDKVI